MGSLVPLAVRIDVSRLIDRSQPFRAAQPPRLSPGPPDFHPSEGVDSSLGRLHDATAPPWRDCAPYPPAHAGKNRFSRGPLTLGCPMRLGWLILELSDGRFQTQSQFFRLDATGNPAAKRRPGPMNSRPIPACDGAGAQSSAVSDSARCQLAEAKKTRVLVTGADGFVGRHLVPYLVAQGYSVIAASRAVTSFNNPDVTAVPLSDLSRLFDWQPLLDQCDAVVHLAGIAHKYAGDDFL